MQPCTDLTAFVVYQTVDVIQINDGRTVGSNKRLGIQCLLEFVHRAFYDEMFLVLPDQYVVVICFYPADIVDFDNSNTLIGFILSLAPIFHSASDLTSFGH